MRRRMGVLVDKLSSWEPSDPQFCAGRHILWIMSHSTVHLEQMPREFIEEAERWELEPTLASLWWTSTDADEKDENMMIKTQNVLHKFPFEKSSKVLV